MTEPNKNESKIINGILRLRHAFLSARLKPPAAIHLASHEEGDRLIAEIEQTKFLICTPPDKRFGKPVEMADGSVYMEVEIVGVKVRWPADRLKMMDGKWTFV